MMNDELITEKEAASFLRLQPRTLTVWRCHKKGPRFLKIGKTVYYRKEWLREFLEACEVRT